FCLCVMAERYNEGRNAEDGLAILEWISTEDRSAFYAPEIHRLEGELRRQLPSPDTEQIERCFHTALLLARRRGCARHNRGGDRSHPWADRADTPHQRPTHRGRAAARPALQAAL